MFKSTPVKIIGAAVLFVAGGVGWWLLSPLFIDQKVDEAFPLAEKAAVPQNMTKAQAETTMRTMAKVNQEMREEMPGAMATAQRFKTGRFRDADDFHKGSGEATIYKLPDGGHLLRLQDLNVTNGPQLHVLLVRHPNPTERPQVKSPGYIDLGRLKGNIGNQNYVIPKDADVGAHASVVIYCKPFQVIFSVASLKKAGS